MEATLFFWWFYFSPGLAMFFKAFGYKIYIMHKDI
jgi:hypothetical protein